MAARAGPIAECNREVVIRGLPSDVRTRAEASLRAFCDHRVPAFARNKVRLEVEFRGSNATIYECRPPFLSSFIPAGASQEWTRLSIAQFRFSAETQPWTLYCADRHSRWHVYYDLDPSDKLEDLIAEVDKDPTGIFWG